MRPRISFLQEITLLKVSYRNKEPSVSKVFTWWSTALLSPQTSRCHCKFQIAKSFKGHEFTTFYRYTGGDCKQVCLIIRLTSRREVSAQKCVIIITVIKLQESIFYLSFRGVYQLGLFSKSLLLQWRKSNLCLGVVLLGKIGCYCTSNE